MSPRIVPPAEARDWMDNFREGSTYHDIAHTAVVLGEQREAGLALHRPGYKDPRYCAECTCVTGVSYPCPTARALGVTE